MVVTLELNQNMLPGEMYVPNQHIGEALTRAYCHLPTSWDKGKLARRWQLEALLAKIPVGQCECTPNQQRIVHHNNQQERKSL